jgi:hypothetical protein
MERRPAIFWLADFDGFRLGCRRSALGLVFDGVEHPVSGSCDLLLDGMVGSVAAARFAILSVSLRMERAV